MDISSANWYTKSDENLLAKLFIYNRMRKRIDAFETLTFLMIERDITPGDIHRSTAFCIPKVEMMFRSIIIKRFREVKVLSSTLMIAPSLDLILYTLCLCSGLKPNCDLLRLLFLTIWGSKIVICQRVVLRKADRREIDR